MTPEEQQVAEVLSRFKFERVLQHMHHMNWTWGGRGRVPTLEELRDTARYLFVSLVNQRSEEPVLRHSTGGFVAERFFLPRKDAPGFRTSFRLSFVVCKADEDL
jgi:hypothetical protein